MLPDAGRTDSTARGPDTLLLDALELAMRLCWQTDVNRVAGPYQPTRENNAHDTSFILHPSVGRAAENRSHEPRLKLIELVARVAQAGEFDDGRSANVQLRVNRKRQQIEASSGDVLADLACTHGESLR